MALKKISEGAEADIYELELLGIKALMKYRRPKPYLAKEIEESLRNTRTGTEARILSKASSLISAPKPLLITKYAIIMQKLEGIQASRNTSLGKYGAKASGKALATLLAFIAGFLTMLHTKAAVAIGPIAALLTIIMFAYGFAAYGILYAAVIAAVALMALVMQAYSLVGSRSAEAVEEKSANDQDNAEVQFANVGRF